MKKKILIITIMFMFLFVSFGVSAREKVEYTEAGVNENVANYYSARDEMAALGCNGTIYTRELVDKCNTLGLSMNNSLVYIFNANNENPTVISSEAKQLIEDNKDNCSNVFSSTIQDILNKVFLLFYIAGPILLLLFGSMDFFSAIIAGDERKRKALYTKFIKRAVALLLLFVSPVLVKLLINSFGGDSLPKDVYSCKYTSKKVTIAYTPAVSKKRKNGKNRGKGSYGPSDGSVLLHVDCSSYTYQWCTEGDYVVIDTQYPGGIEGFSEMVRENGITQDSDGSWGDCCAGFAQAHACGLHNGMELTESDLGLEHGDNSCNGISGGCTGIWAWNDSTCFYTVEEYMDYIIENIQHGIPVMTVVTVDTSSSGRHFVTIIGYRADTDGTTTHDLLILDSWDGRIDTFDESARGTGYQSIIGYYSHPCGSDGAQNGDYELWASANRN